MTTISLDSLMSAYFNAKTPTQKEKALKEIQKHGGQTAVNLVLWTEQTTKGSK